MSFPQALSPAGEKPVKHLCGLRKHHVNPFSWATSFGNSGTIDTLYLRSKVSSVEHRGCDRTQGAGPAGAMLSRDGYEVCENGGPRELWPRGHSSCQCHCASSQDWDPPAWHNPIPAPVSLGNSPSSRESISAHKVIDSLFVANPPVHHLPPKPCRAR